MLAACQNGLPMRLLAFIVVSIGLLSQYTWKVSFVKRKTPAPMLMVCFLLDLKVGDPLGILCLGPDQLEFRSCYVHRRCDIILCVYENLKMISI